MLGRLRTLRVQSVALLLLPWVASPTTLSFGGGARKQCRGGGSAVCVLPANSHGAIYAQDFVTSFKYFTGHKVSTNLRHFLEKRLDDDVQNLRWLFGLRHAWVALGALHGAQAIKMREKLARIHHKFGAHATKAAKEMKRLSKEKGELQDLLKLAAGCLVPVDLGGAKAGLPGLAAQRARVRPPGKLTTASRMLLSSPDGSLDESKGPRMPLLGMGTGYSDCMDGHMVEVIQETWESKDGLEHIEKEKGGCELPPPSLYKKALSSGTRLIDTAYIYGTEADIGTALAESKIPRDEVFVITKPMTNAFKHFLHVERAVSRIGEQLKRLRTDHVNLLLWHHDELTEVEDWQSMEKMVDEKRAVLLGTSGAERGTLGAWRSAGKVRYFPSVEQQELGPCSVAAFDDLGASAGNVTMLGITTVWYCLGEPLTRQLSKRLGKSVAQVTLRWVLEQGVPVLAQTENSNHLKQNAAIFDFQLGATDMALLSGLSWLYSSVPLSDDQEVSSTVPDTLGVALLVAKELGKESASLLNKKRRVGLPQRGQDCPDWSRAGAVDTSLRWLLDTQDSADGYAVEPAAAAVAGDATTAG